jgi:hypothetical protein
MANSGIVQQLKTERDRVRKQLNGLETDTRSFCSRVRWKSQTDTQTPQDVSEVMSKDCSGTEKAVGEGQTATEGRPHCPESRAPQADDVLVGSS